MSIVRRAHLLSAAFGLMMVAAAGFQTAGPTLVLAMFGAAMVLVGIPFRSAATVAVLSAACYLVLRYTEGGSTRVLGASAPAMLAALGFTFVGVLAASFPFELPWLPLLAPAAVFAIYVLATRPFYQAAEGKLDISSRS